MAMEIAREVSRRALDPDASNEAACEISLAFTRIAKTVRQTIALEAKLETEAAAAARGEVRARGAQNRRDARRLVERVIAEVSEDDAEDLLDSLEERLLDEDDTRFGDAPLGEIVARICRDLGVEFDPDLWADDLPPPTLAATPANIQGGEPAAQPAAPDPDAWLKDPPAGSG
jgi:hypothetical protein